MTPDIAFLAALLAGDLSPLQQRYIRDTAAMNGTEPTPAAVVNYFVRSWGHQFIYSQTALSDALTGAGFVQVESFALNQSDDPRLRGLEHPERLPDGFLALESMTLEATKPG